MISVKARSFGKIWGISETVATSITMKYWLMTDGCFYIVLFSTFKRNRSIRCAFVTCDFKWVTAALKHFFIVHFKYIYIIYIHWSGVLTMLLIVSGYMAGAVWNCCCLGPFWVHHTTTHHLMSFHAKPRTYNTNSIKPDISLLSYNLLTKSVS